MNILTIYFTAGRLFTFVREGMMYLEFNSVTLFTVLYSCFLNCTKSVSKVTAQPNILEYLLTHGSHSLFQFKLEDRSQKKKIMFLLFLRPEKDIKVSAKVLRKCYVSSLILLWQPKSAQSALSSTVFKI